MQQHASRSASVALYVCIGYVQEWSSALQQLLSCVASSSQSSEAVTQQAIVGLTRMAGQHTLVPHYTILKPILRFATHRQHHICVWVLFCPVFTKKAPLAIAFYLCHSLHELFNCVLIITSSSWEQISTCYCPEMSLLDMRLIEQILNTQLLHQVNQAAVCYDCLYCPATSVSQTAMSACLQLPATLTCWNKMPLTHC